MPKTIEGTYHNGQIQLSELPEISEQVRVLVTFLEPGKLDPSKLRQLIEQLETIAGIQQGLEEVNAGQTRPIGQFAQEMQERLQQVEAELQTLKLQALQQDLSLGAEQLQTGQYSDYDDSSLAALSETIQSRGRRRLTQNKPV